MIFIAVIGALFLAIAFIHYTQGMFSATLSAFLCVFAAVIAFSYHETVVEKLLQGQIPNIAHPLVLVVLFALCYVVLRVIFDKAIPSGIRLPAMIDKIGGGVMGCVAATFCTGILAIATQELPFGASVMGYTKYVTSDVTGRIVGKGAGGAQHDGSSFDVLSNDAAGSFAEADRKNLFPLVAPGVDEILVSTVSHLSDGGSLAGGRPLTAIHPDFMQELYGQRAGIQAGANHVTLIEPNSPLPTIKLEGIYRLKEVRLEDAEPLTIRPNQKMPTVSLKPSTRPSVVAPEAAADDKKDSHATHEFKYMVPGADPESGKDQILLVVRVSFGAVGIADAADSTIRLSPGAARLVAHKIDSAGTLHPVNFYPVGTVESAPDAPVLLVNKPDDFIFVNAGSPEHRSGLDLTYLVDKAGLIGADGKILPDVFIEIKRMGRIDLAGMKILPWVAKSGTVELGAMHKRDIPVMKPVAAPPPATAPSIVIPPAAPTPTQPAVPAPAVGG